MRQERVRSIRRTPAAEFRDLGPVATVPVTISNEDEGAPVSRFWRPGILETGAIDTMQAQTSIRLPDTSTALPAACHFSQVSAPRSVSAPITQLQPGCFSRLLQEGWDHP